MASPAGNSSSCDCPDTEVAFSFSQQTIQRLADEVKDEMMVALLGQLQSTAVVCADICMERLSVLQADMVRKLSSDKRRTADMIEHTRETLGSQGVPPSSLDQLQACTFYRQLSEGISASDTDSDNEEDLQIIKSSSRDAVPAETESDVREFSRQDSDRSRSGMDPDREAEKSAQQERPEVTSDGPLLQPSASDMHPEGAAEKLAREECEEVTSDSPRPVLQPSAKHGGDVSCLGEVAELPEAASPVVQDSAEWCELPPSMTEASAVGCEFQSRRRWQNPIWSPLLDEKGQPNSEAKRIKNSMPGTVSSSVVDMIIFTQADQKAPVWELCSVLRKACPNWTLRELSKAESKLKQVGLNSPESLRHVSREALKAKLLAAGLKAFKSETLDAIDRVLANSIPT
mmetsp:Transcript_154499/g.284676  ORF Transcript_154499/g.284676 Transcript_154499/m.284676 type:complete len:401 (+) Transcript_154499:47-1249(+)